MIIKLYFGWRISVRLLWEQSSDSKIEKSTFLRAAKGVCMVVLLYEGFHAVQRIEIIPQSSVRRSGQTRSLNIDTFPKFGNFWVFLSKFRVAIYY